MTTRKPQIEADNRSARRREALEDAKHFVYRALPEMDGRRLISRRQYRQLIRDNAKRLYHGEMPEVPGLEALT